MSTDMDEKPRNEAQEAGTKWRENILLLAAGALVLVLVAALAHQFLSETGGSNSYALLADAFLHGRLDVDKCFDSDCAHFDGKTWVIFPPVPAVVAMPFVALFGVDFSHFIAIGLLAAAGSLLLWWRILEALGVRRDTAIWLLLALAFATPLFYVTLRTDRVWFFAQSIDFLLVSLAIHEVVRGANLIRAGIFIGAAFLCRQMSLFLVPFLFVLALRPEERLISFGREHVVRALKLGLPVAAAVGIYMFYNWVRFGHVMETGYIHIMVPDLDHWTLINHRLTTIGLFSKDYVLFNAFYLFVQGFHVQWGGPDMLNMISFDPMGTSLLAASPFVLLAFFTPLTRPIVVGGLCALAIVAITLFYHGNGFSQYNAQRFVLDWMPVLIFALAYAVRENLRPAFAVLATYGIALNVATVAVLALLPPASS